MNTPSRSRRSTLALGITAAALFAPAALAQTTGFNKTAAGPFDYNDTANWVGTPGVINGIWDPALTLTASQTATFASDTTLTTGVNIGYAGNFDLTLRSDGTANRTITLGGDITVNPVSNRTIFIGSNTANQGLNVNLGAVDRTFTINGGKLLTFLNTISNGDFTLTGNSPTAGGGTLRLSGANGAAASSDITVLLNSNLQFDSSTSGVTGTTRAQSVTLASGGRLIVTGNATANSADTITGAITVDGSAWRATNSGNSVSAITITPNAGRNTLLTADSLARTGKAVVLMRGVNLGANTIASATANNGNFQLTGTAPALVGGGGAAGTTNIGIVPWIIGGTTAADGGSTFVTYTAANGFRPLNTGTEFAPTIGVNATDNVRLVGATALDGTATVNSLINTSGALSGTDALTVTSGAVFISVGAASISKPLDFGTAEGVVGYARGSTISGAIAGSGGLTVYGTRTDENLNFNNGASTYTGNTTVLGNMQVSAGFLPNGARTGDVYVYGNMQLSVSSFNGTINGLFGTGTVGYGNSGESTLRIGDNNATSTFTGTINGNANLNLSKIGAGTLTLAGANTNARVVSILGGTLEVTQLANGAVASGIGSSSSVATNLVLNGGTLKYSGVTTSTDRLFTVGALGAGLDASGSGAVNFSNTGANVSSEAANRAGTRTTGSNVVTGVANFADLVVGARVTGTGITGGTTITAIDTVAGTITLSANATADTSANLSFQTNRVLALTGSNTGDNTISGVLANATSTGSLAITKSGTGTWTLSAANTYTGGTHINGGTLVAAHANALGTTGTVSFGGGTLRYGTGVTTDLSARLGTTSQAYRIDTNGNDVTFATAFGGSAANTLVKSGLGTLTLSATNTYTGATTVSGGTLSLSGSIASSAATIQDGATLALASGTAGAVTIDSGAFLTGSGTVGATTVNGTLAIGNSPGTLTLSEGASLTLGGTSVSNFEFTSSGFGFGTYDLVVGTPGGAPESVTFGGTLNLAFTGLGYVAGDDVARIFDLGSFSGSFTTVNVTGLDSFGLAAEFDALTGQISLVAAIPEPSAFAALAGLGVLALAATRRRSRR